MDFTAYQFDIIQKHLNKRIDGCVYIIEVDTKEFSSWADIVIRFPREFSNASRRPDVYLYRVESIKIKDGRTRERPYLCESGMFRWQFFFKDCDRLDFYMLCDSPKAAAEYIRYSLSNNWRFKGKTLDKLVDFFDLEVNVRW